MRRGQKFRGSYSVKQDKDVETEIIINEGAENETLYEVTFNRKTEWSHDHNYGADADGHRGVPMDFIDEDYAEDIEVRKDGDKDFVALATLPKELQEQLQKQIDNWLERNEPEYEEHEPDCDDLGDDE